MASRCGAAGFTLVELVTLMMVLGILVFVALPRLDLLRGYDERGFNDKLLAGIQFARKAAVAKRRHVCVQVADASTVTFVFDIRQPEAAVAPLCTGANGADLPLPVADRNRGGACAAGNALCAPPGVTITAPAAGTSFSFDGLGRASAAVVFQVTGSRDITVEQESGYVHH